VGGGLSEASPSYVYVHKLGGSPVYFVFSDFRVTDFQITFGGVEGRTHWFIFLLLPFEQLTGVIFDVVGLMLGWHDWQSYVICRRVWICLVMLIGMLILLLG